MKVLISVLLTLVLAGSAGASTGVKPAAEPQTAGPATTLNIAAHYLDSIFVNALATLELIASTPEARSGDWPGIKAYLRQAAAVLPGAYFFVLPDGNYYSVAMDYTNLNLADRPYFNSLFAGHPVMGFPIYSRSSGKKSALVAAPIVVDRKVTGAIGASVFLHDLHEELNRVLALPPGYTWFVLDAEGNTMLDRDSDFIFMNAFTQGSESMREAVAEALGRESGAMQYDLGGLRQGHYRKLPILNWWMVLAKIEGAAIQPPQPDLSLARFVPALQNRLDEIDGSLANLIAKHRPDVGKESEIRELLSVVIKENLQVVEAAFVDRQGFLRQIEPDEYKNFENTDIGTQAHVVAMRQTPRPVFSGGFDSVEGFPAVDLAHPLYDGEGGFVGSLSALIRPALLIDPLLKNSTVSPDDELWIMQPDGLIIYDRDPEEIGRMLFSDPLYAGYESLLDLGKKIAAEPAGQGSYIFPASGSQEKVIKNALWQTVRLHGREWRVVLAHRPYNNQ